VCNATPLPLDSQERFPVSIAQEEALGSVWTVWRTGSLLRTPRFDPRTIQPVVSRYADYAIPALFISGLPLPNLIENAPLFGVVKHTDEQKGVCALPIVLALCDLLE
jgi:hypothetical protein